MRRSPTEHTKLFVTGKGGVGKTTVCAALALSLASRGKRVLIAMCNAKERISVLFGTPPVGPEEVLGLGHPVVGEPPHPLGVGQDPDGVDVAGREGVAVAPGRTGHRQPAEGERRRPQGGQRPRPGRGPARAGVATGAAGADPRPGRRHERRGAAGQRDRSVAVPHRQPRGPGGHGPEHRPPAGRPGDLEAGRHRQGEQRQGGRLGEHRPLPHRHRGRGGQRHDRRGRHPPAPPPHDRGHRRGQGGPAGHGERGLQRHVA
ncbi:MAG: ArsA-related P-loop ATPase [Acidimicrobiia bacterium]